jgi:hypothetical protein
MHREVVAGLDRALYGLCYLHGVDRLAPAVLHLRPTTTTRSLVAFQDECGTAALAEGRVARLDRGFDALRVVVAPVDNNQVFLASGKTQRRLCPESYLRSSSHLGRGPDPVAGIIPRLVPTVLAPLLDASTSPQPDKALGLPLLLLMPFRAAKYLKV